MNYTDLKPTREDANLAIKALRTLMVLDEVFPDLIPRSYADLHTRLFHSLSVRDLVRNEFPVATSDIRGDVHVEDKDQATNLSHLKEILA